MLSFKELTISEGSLFFLMMNIMQRSTNKAASICLFYLIVKYLWCKPINLDFNEQIPQDNVSVCSLHFQLDIFRSHHIFSIGCPRHCLIQTTQFDTLNSTARLRQVKRCPPTVFSNRKPVSGGRQRRRWTKKNVSFKYLTWCISGQSQPWWVDHTM